MDKTKRIEIDVDEFGQGRLVIDGHDLSDITEGVSLVLQPGHRNEVNVKFSAHQVALRGYASVQGFLDEFNETEQDDGVGGSESL